MKKYWKIYEDKYVNIEGINTRFWEIGKGNEYLLFIHGFGGAVEEWIFNIPYFENKYHIYAVDLPGQGGTEKQNISYTYELYLKFINTFIDKFNIKLVTIIGHCLGGMIALLYSIKYPDKINKLVLISPAFSKKYNLFLRLLTIPIIGEIFLKPPSSYNEVNNSFNNLTYYKFEMPIEIVKRAYEFYNSSGYIKSSLSYFRNYLNLFGLSKKGIELYKYFKNYMKYINKSVLLFWGKKDKIISIKNGKLIIKNIKNIKYYEIENCGHNPHWELSDKFNKTVKKFI